MRQARLEMWIKKLEFESLGKRWSAIDKSVKLRTDKQRERDADKRRRKRLISTEARAFNNE